MQPNNSIFIADNNATALKAIESQKALDIQVAEIKVSNDKMAMLDTIEKIINANTALTEDQKKTIITGGNNALAIDTSTQWGKVQSTISSVTSATGGYVDGWATQIGKDSDNVQSSLNDAIDVWNSFLGVTEAAGGSMVGLQEAISRAISEAEGALAGANQVVTSIGKAGMSEGGLVTKPTIALIGEAGPELVIPLRKAGSYLGGAEGGGEPVQQHITNTFYISIGNVSSAVDLPR